MPTRVSKLARVIASIIVVVSFAIAAESLADQRVHFKNGHVLDVEKATEDGNVVYLKLADGSEVGFPKALIEKIESGSQIQASSASRSNRGHAMRGQSLTNLPGYQRQVAESRGQLDREVRMKSDFGEGKGADRPVTVGYSRWGSQRAGSASRVAPEQMSMKEARGLMRKRQLDNSRVNANPGAGSGAETETGPILARPKLADRPAEPTESDR
jgi:hypothetical protein